MEWEEWEQELVVLEELVEEWEQEQLVEELQESGGSQVL